MPKTDIFEKGGSAAGWTVVDPNAPQPAPRAEIVNQPSTAAANVMPDVRVHDPAIFAGLTADHALRVASAQQIPMDADKYFQIFDKAIQDANQYRIAQAKVAPGGEEAQRAQIQIQKELTQKQLEQGQSAVAEAARRGALPGQPGGGVPGVVSRPSEAQQKAFDSYTEGFHNLQDLHTLFDNMATKTVGAGGPFQSLAGATTRLTDLTSPEARVYHAYVDSSLIPLAKSIMGDAATTAGKETVQSAMTEALPTNVDTLQTGGQKIFMFYKRALDKMQIERDSARQNGVDTSSIDTALNDFHSFFNSNAVQKYNPLQPLVQSGVSAQTQNAQNTQAAINTRNAALAGTNAPQQQQQITQPSQAGAYTAPPSYGAPQQPGYVPGQGMQAAGSEESVPYKLGQAVLSRLGETWTSGKPEVSAAPAEIPSTNYSDYGGQ
jgi:hypothetical protein